MNPDNPLDNQGPAAPPQPPQPSPVPPSTEGAPVAPPASSAPQAHVSPQGVAPQQQPVFGEATSPQGPLGAPPQRPRGKNKLPLMIGVIAVALLAIGVGAWALMTFVLGSISLTTHETSTYSVLVPEGYEKEESGSTVAFREREEESESEEEGSTRSSVTLTQTSLEGLGALMSRDELIKYYDEMFTEKNLTEAVPLTAVEEGRELRNFSKTEDEFKGFEARRITLDGYKDDQRVGTVTLLVVFTDSDIITLNISAHQGDAGLLRATDEIVDSLTIKD